MGHCPMQCCPKILILLNEFLYSFGRKFLKDVLLWLGVETQNVSFILSLKDNAEYIS